MTEPKELAFENRRILALRRISTAAGHKFSPLPAALYFASQKRMSASFAPCVGLTLVSRPTYDSLQALANPLDELLI
jgi:hypothetical protein